MKKPSDNTFAYIARNFFFLLPIVALPVVLLTVFQRETGAFDLLAEMAKTTAQTGSVKFSDFFSDLYAKVSIINFDRFADWNVSKVWFWLVTAIVVMLGFSLTVAHIERHMRLGVKEPFKWMSMMKSGAYNAFFYSLIMLVFYELCMVALSSFILLNSRIMNGWWAFGMVRFGNRRHLRRFYRRILLFAADSAFDVLRRLPFRICGELFDTSGCSAFQAVCGRFCSHGVFVGACVAAA